MEENSVNGRTSQNQADVTGGVGAASPIVVTVTGTRFKRNEAEYGGAIYGSSGAKLTISNNAIDVTNPKISLNNAEYGGAIYTATDATLTVSKVGFGANNATIGGAMYLNSHTTIADSLFRANTAQSGGAIAIIGDLLSLSSGIYEHNSATIGGVVYVGNQSSLITNSGIFMNNEAEDGGVIYQDATTELIDIIGGTYQFNVADGTGGAIYADYQNLANLKVSASATFTNNHAPQGYLQHEPALDAIYNANILSHDWSRPYSQGYNGYDIGGIGDLIGFDTFDNILVSAIKNPLGDSLVGGEFTYGLYLAADDSLVATGTNDADGFIELHIPRLKVTGTSENLYIKELSGPPDWSLDATVFNVQVVVIKDQYGNFGVRVTYPLPSNAPPDAHPYVPTFINKKNDATCGIVEFDEIYFTTPGDYQFYIEELSQSSGGFVVDTDRHEITIHVEMNQNGNLIATPIYDSDGYPHFLNVYVQSPARYKVSACKIGIGSGLPPGRFQFGLFNQAGQKVRETSNAAADKSATKEGDELLRLTREYKKLTRRGNIKQHLPNVSVNNNPKRAAHVKRSERISMNCTHSEQSDKRLLERYGKLREAINKLEANGENAESC